MSDYTSEIEHSGIIFHIVRSSRKSVVGRVLPDCSVEIRAPLSMTTNKINALLDTFESKLSPTIDAYRKINANIAGHPFGYGGEVLYKGKWTPIKESEDNSCGSTALFRDGEIIVKQGMREAEMRCHIGRLFSYLAKPIFEAKLRYFSNLMNVRFNTWSVGSARKRHGSCDSNGKIILSWRIIMMNEAVVDYVIVHELAHLKHMNHAKVFYNEVATVFPDWKDRRALHRNYSDFLRCGGWL